MFVRIFLLSHIVWLALCNVEKVIFTAPEAASLPADASIDNLLLTSLNPTHLTARTYLNASFPTNENPKGTQSWLLLEGLNPGQRYEVRICWLATQPTSFWLDTYTTSQTFETPVLISSLSSYAYQRHAMLNQDQLQTLDERKSRSSSRSDKSSLLFLQIDAAADYFTLNKTLMQDVPPVHVDIILDPYILNIFPQSLIPTAAYIVCVALGAWFLSAWVARKLHQISTGHISAPADEKKTK